MVRPNGSEPLCGVPESVSCVLCGSSPAKLVLQMPAKKESVATVKKEAWSVTCGDAGIKDCGFFIREHDAKRMVKFVQEHLKHAHKMDVDEKTILGLSKKANW